MELRDKNGRTLEEFLASYNEKDYKQPSVTADTAVFYKTEKGYEILLIERAGHPYIGYYALPGGFCEEGETVLQTAQRELFEETNLSGLCLEPVGLFSDVGRDPRTWCITKAYLTITDNKDDTLAKDDASAAKWFSIYTRRHGDNITITFTCKEERFDAQVREAKTCGITREQVNYEIISSGMLAFDHTKIISQAMNKLSLL